MAAAKQDLRNIPPPPPPYRGGRLWSTTLDDDEVRKIRKMAAAGWSISDLADRYHVTWATMAKIVKGLSWKHVKSD